MSLFNHKQMIVILLVSVLFASWCLMPAEAKTKEEIYQDKLAALATDDIKGHYQLGIWCKRNKLAEQTTAQFEKVIELDEAHPGARRKLGYINYKKRWVKPDEKSRVDYEEKLTRIKDDDVKGHYRLGIWCKQRKLVDAARTEFEKVLQLDPEHKQARNELDNISELAKEVKISELIKRYVIYKGVLDKSGADKERRPWDKARAIKTEHFMVKTNLSVDALNDLCFLMECAYLTYQDFFGFPEPKEKIGVSVLQNKVEYAKTHNDILGADPELLGTGKYVPKEAAANRSRKDYIIAYYFRKGEKTTPTTLIHESLHYAIYLVIRAYNLSSLPPIWLNEGLATYFESSKVEDKRLVTNLINRDRLPAIKTALNNNTYIKLKEFINLSHSEYTSLLSFAEGWSLVYFLFNGKNGKYKQRFRSYIEAWKNEKIEVLVGRGDSWIQDKAAHTKLFEECMGVSIDQLEKEWKEYIRALK